MQSIAACQEPGASQQTGLQQLVKACQAREFRRRLREVNLLAGGAATTANLWRLLQLDSLAACGDQSTHSCAFGESGLLDLGPMPTLRDSDETGEWQLLRSELSEMFLVRGVSALDL